MYSCMKPLNLASEPRHHLCLQADVVLSRLVGSCRRHDPQLLSELRGELLYLARVLEEPVRPECLASTFGD
jgi:hypothetical protein